VHSISQIYVAAHLDELRHQAAQERLAAENKSSRRTGRFGQAVRSVWSFISDPADRPIAVPTLNNYPYRG
jgi:hypothetical protein